jgi:parallel beta-helix repeat protein
MPKFSNISPISLFILTFLIPIRIYAAGNTYYVAKSGCSDSNAGSLSGPFCSISKGIGVMQPGDTLLLRAGTYPSFEVKKSGTNGNYLTIQSYNGEHVTVSGGGSTIDINGSDYIHIKGLEVTGATGNYGAGIRMKSSSNNNLIEENTVHGNLGPHTHGIMIDSGSYNIISDNIAYNNTEVGLKIQGTSTGNQLLDNTSYGNVGDPPNSDGIAVSDATSTNTLIQGNNV